MKPSVQKPQITVIEGDYGYYLEFTLKDSEGAVIDLGSNSYFFNLQRQGKSTLNVSARAMTIVSAPAGTCKVLIANGDFNKEGKYYGEVYRNNGGVVQTFEEIDITCRPQLPR